MLGQKNFRSEILTKKKQDLGLQCQTPLRLKAFAKALFHYVWFGKLWTIFDFSYSTP